VTTEVAAVRGKGLRPAEGLVLGAALVWSALIVVGATKVSVYQGETETFTQGGSGTVTRSVSQGSSTLVDENGSGILLVVAIPWS
jgi:hypothetical protein